MDLAVVIEHGPQGCIIAKLCGELDIATAPDLREQLLEILDRRTPNRLVLDLSKLDFIDSSGVAVLVNTERRAKLLGCTLALAAPQAQASRVLEICGLDRSFPIYENITAARRGEQPDFRPFSPGLAPEAVEPDRPAT